ncbi:MAG TPA: GGDEF domain-containing protein [Mycobacteriales bacterium]|nr:GGDEF domain-containing protein [Mycobacteriales bacterium]
MTQSGRARGDRWLARFGDDVPAFARALEAAVTGASTGRELTRAAESLGVLRAQQGHAVAGLTEDMLALREVVGATTAEQLLVVDTALRLAVSAYVDELVAVLSSQATRDPLTGLPNRAAFDEALAHELAGVGRAAPPSLLLVDLDRFKAVNDTEGHLAGDAVLKAVADVLRGHVRPTDVACRLGGDEFAIVLPRTGALRALQVARRLLNAARKAPGLEVGDTGVTLSIGVGWLPSPADAAELIGLADRSLYAVKSAGGDDAHATVVEDITA